MNVYEGKPYDKQKSTANMATYYGYDTNNQYPAFPSMMNDGRSVVSSWEPESMVDSKLKMENGIRTNWEYRRYLMKNADAILTQNFKQAQNDTGYAYASDDVLLSSYQPPYMYKSISDKNPVFGMNNGPLKAEYLSREEHMAAIMVPAMTQEQLYLLLQNKRQYNGK